MDGASRLQIFLRIICPIAVPGTVSTLLYDRLLRSYGPPGAVSYHWYECVSLFVQDKVAMSTDANVLAGIPSPRTST